MVKAQAKQEARAEHLSRKQRAEDIKRACTCMCLCVEGVCVEVVSCLQLLSDAFWETRFTHYAQYLRDIGVGIWPPLSIPALSQCQTPSLSPCIISAHKPRCFPLVWLLDRARTEHHDTNISSEFFLYTTVNAHVFATVRASILLWRVYMLEHFIVHKLYYYMNI